MVPGFNEFDPQRNSKGTFHNNAIKAARKTNQIGIYMPGGAQPHPREKYAGGAIDLQKIPLIHWIQVGNM